MEELRFPVPGGDRGRGRLRFSRGHLRGLGPPGGSAADRLEGGQQPGRGERREDQRKEPRRISKRLARQQREGHDPQQRCRGEEPGRAAAELEERQGQAGRQEERIWARAAARQRHRAKKER